MKIKNLLSGIAAMLVAVGMAFGFATPFTANGAYRINPLDENSLCIAHATSCDLPITPNECIEPVVGRPITQPQKIYENIGTGTNVGDTTLCGNSLFKVVR
jgi:hypothetical protein